MTRGVVQTIGSQVFHHPECGHIQPVRRLISEPRPGSRRAKCCTWRWRQGVTLLIEPPCAFINANDRAHFHKKAKLTKEWRVAGLVAAGQAPRHIYDRAHVVVSIRFPTNQRRDVGNYYPTAKAILDGIVARKRFLLDDDDAHIVGPDMRREYPNGTPRVTVTITPLEETP